MVKANKYTRSLEKIQSSVKCSKYNVPEEMLDALNKHLTEEENAASKDEREPDVLIYDKRTFLELIGMSADEIDNSLPQQTNNLTWCLRGRILGDVRLKRHNIYFGYHKTDGNENDQITVKRLPETKEE